MITDSLMALGSWDLQLKPGAPTNIRRAFTWGAQVFFTAVHLGDESVSWSTLKATAAFVGVTMRRGSSLTRFGGPGPTGYLQTGKGHGGSGQTLAFPATFTQVCQNFFAGTGTNSNGLNIGTSFSPTATTVDAADAYSYHPPTKPKLDEWAKATGNEYRINPDFTVDYGVSTSLFVSTPTVVIAPGFRGREGTYNLLNVTQWDVAEDLDDFRNAGNALRSDLAAAVSGAPPTGATVNFQHAAMSGGNAAYGSEYVVADSTDIDDVTDLATALANEYCNYHRDYSGCAVKEYCLPRILNAGDYVYVYDLDSDIYDTANQISVMGEVMFPQKVRCQSITYPIEAGMGVYTYYNGTLTDITDYVQWETDAESSVMLEALPRRVTDPIPRSLVG